MANKANASFVVNAGGGWSYLARITLHDGEDATQEDISTITRTIVDRQTGQSVTDSVTVATAVHDELQSNAVLWDKPFNFKDDVPASKIPNRYRYTLQYTITPTVGEAIKTREIDIEGD